MSSEEDGLDKASSSIKGLVHHMESGFYCINDCIIDGHFLFNFLIFVDSLELEQLFFIFCPLLNASNLISQVRMIHNFGLNIRRLSTPLNSAFGPRSLSRRQYIFLDLLVNSTGIDNVINRLISLTDLSEVIFVNDSLLFFLLLIIFTHPYEFLFLCRCWLYGLLALLVVESVAETYGLVLCGCWRSVCGCAWFLRLVFGLL